MLTEELIQQFHKFSEKGNTSVDDSVSNWFSCFNKNTGEWEYSKLSENKEFCAEFVVIEDNKIKQFISNLDYKY